MVRIVVSNADPNDVTGATVSDPFPDELTGVTWTCDDSGGGTCTTGDDGDINDSVDLPSGTSVTYTASGTYSPPSGVEPCVNTATVVSPTTVSDPDPSDNSASARIESMLVAIFGDGFESGDTTAW